MIKLVQSDNNDYFEKEMWIVDFIDHKPLNFKNKEDMLIYLNGGISSEHGIMEYDRIPHNVTHEEYFNINNN